MQPAELTIPEKFFNLFPSTSEFGFFQRDDNDGYPCTPLNAKIIGWTGVDGIHICFIPSISADMVFVVNPCFSDSYVYPVAKSFHDFLSLLLCFSEFAAMELPVYDEKVFYSFVEEIRADIPPERQLCLDKLQNCLNISPMKDPYSYLKDLQADFDYATIPFSEEYYALL